MRLQPGSDRIAATPPPVVTEQRLSAWWNPLRRSAGPVRTGLGNSHQGRGSAGSHIAPASALGSDEDDFLNRLRCAGL
jgi:hypothetical protein